MSATRMLGESRRSTGVPLKVAIELEDGCENFNCDGETVVVNLHGALISTAFGLSVGMRISIHVYLTDKRGKARVVYVDPQNPLRCGVELDQPRNIWGAPLPLEDWDETADLHATRREVTRMKACRVSSPTAPSLLETLRRGLTFSRMAIAKRAACEERSRLSPLTSDSVPGNFR